MYSTQYVIGVPTTILNTSTLGPLRNVYIEYCFHANVVIISTFVRPPYLHFVEPLVSMENVSIRRLKSKARNSLPLPRARARVEYVATSSIESGTYVPVRVYIRARSDRRSADSK